MYWHQPDYFHSLRQDMRLAGASKSHLQVIRLFKRSLIHQSGQIHFFTLIQNTCRCVLSGFIINVPHFVKRSCTSYSSCSVLVEMVAATHQWTQLKAKFSLQLELSGSSLFLCFFLPKVLLLFERWNLVETPQMALATIYFSRGILMASNNLLNPRRQTGSSRSFQLCFSSYTKQNKFAADATYYLIVSKLCGAWLMCSWCNFMTRAQLIVPLPGCPLPPSHSWMHQLELIRSY